MIELRLLVNSNNVIGVKEQLKNYLADAGDTTVLSVKILADDDKQIGMEDTNGQRNSSK